MKPGKALRMVRQLMVVALLTSAFAAGPARAADAPDATPPAPFPALDAKHPESWPDALDAVVAAPANHRVLLENDRVRVLDVTVRPGEREHVHFHRWPSVLYIEKRESFILYDGQGKVLVDSRLNAPMQYPLTLWMEPQALHAVENLSQREAIHLIRIEIKK